MVMMERMGADGVRWALYSGTVPGQNTRFFEGAVSDAVREFLLKIWNVYSFFTSYANIDGFDPAAPRPALAARSSLDRHVLASLERTTSKVQAELDVFKSHMAVRHLESFVDTLSNWYVRRSRDRFWAGGDSVDKAAAFATLYEVLVDLAKLIAPFTPFMAEALYQNLVRKVDPSALCSVHLTSFPTPDEARRDDALLDAVSLTRTAVTLGQRVRNDLKIKTRQPLAEAVIVVASDSERASLERFVDDVKAELNVVSVAFTAEPAKYVEFKLLPNFRALGPKMGQKLPELKKALESVDAASVYDAMCRDGKVEITLPSGPVTLESSEIEVRLSAKPGFAAASEAGRVVVLDTHMTDALKRAGLAREVVSRIQKLRKQLDLAFDARIRVTYEANDELETALAEHASYVSGEVLAVSFEKAAATGEIDRVELDGHVFAVGVVAA